MGKRTGHIRAALVVIGAVAAIAPSAAAAQDNTTLPAGVVCSTYDVSASTTTIRAQARNTDNSIQTVPIGANNFFYPNLDDRGQPAQFTPGLQSWDLTLDANGQELFWGLNGKYLNFTPYLDSEAAQFGRPCPDVGPQITAVVPPSLRPGVSDQRVSVFGQGLAGATASVRGGGVTAAAVTDTSDQRLDVIVDVDGGATGARDLFVADPKHRQTGCRNCLTLDAPVSEQGPTGPQGPTGADGRAGASTVARASSDPVHFRGTKATSTAVCPEGSSVVSGGHDVTGARGLSVLVDRPSDARSWQVTVRADRANANARLRAYATCLSNG